MDNEEIQGVKFSQFPSATPGDSDEVVGLHNDDNARFSVANFVLAIRQGLANIFVPQTRTINSKSLSSDITLTMDDISNGTTYAKTTAAQVAQIGTNAADIDTIEGKIPSAASTTNQLADKAFVTDSITQGTAIFRGSFATKAALLAVAWQTTDPDAPNFVSNNDYAVVLDDETQNDECWRYIYVTGTGWTPQYKINESPMTQAQLDALNSGATAAIISSVADKLDKTGDGKDVTATFTAASTRANISTGEKLSVLFGKISKWFTDLGTAAFRAATGNITSGSTDLVESGAVYTGLAGKQNTITASGILKGDGQGGVSAAAAGTDFQPPLTFDATPTANSTNPVQSGGVYTDVRTRVPVYGMGKNLLDNAYFVGGGSQQGGGQFPINQRGQTVYPSTASGLYFIDRWAYQCRYGTVTLTPNGINMAVTAASGANWMNQTILGDSLLNKQLTVSILDSQGNLRTFPVKVTAKNVNVDHTVTLDGVGMIVRINIGTNFVFTIRKDSTVFDITIQAIKLELGTEQTLAHQENGVWVLNEIPDYEYELYRCITSTADSSDTYANKSLATEQQLAYVETGATASRNYAVGEYFCWNGLLYRAKTAISNGAAFTVGTNCEAMTSGGLNAIAPKQLLNELITGAGNYSVPTLRLYNLFIVNVLGNDVNFRTLVVPPGVSTQINVDATATIYAHVTMTIDLTNIRVSVTSFSSSTWTQAVLRVWGVALPV